MVGATLRGEKNTSRISGGGAVKMMGATWDEVEKTWGISEEEVMQMQTDDESSWDEATRP